MRITRKITVFLLTGFLLVLAACEDNSDVDPQGEASKLTGTSSKSWKITTMKNNSNNYPIDNCILDNLLTFSNNKTYDLSEGAVKCKNPQAESGTWSLSGSSLSLRSSGNAYTYYTIKSLTASKMVATINSSSSSTNKIEVTFQAQ
jgi:hypothetical protein